MNLLFPQALPRGTEQGRLLTRFALQAAAPQRERAATRDDGQRQPRSRNLQTLKKPTNQQTCYVQLQTLHIPSVLLEAGRKSVKYEWVLKHEADVAE